MHGLTILTHLTGFKYKRTFLCEIRCLSLRMKGGESIKLISTHRSVSFGDIKKLIKAFNGNESHLAGV